VLINDYRKLNLGSGNVPERQFPLPWLNVDLVPAEGGYSCDIRRLPESWSGNFDEVRASHVLEHFFLAEGDEILREWVRVLRPGGILRVVIPDLDVVVRDLMRGFDSKGREAFSVSESTPILTQIYGLGYETEATDARWRHRIIANQVMLTDALAGAGLTEIYPYDRRDDPAALLGVDDDSQNRFSLCLIGRKEG
jgi:SAM-dependent methyltransferase